MEVRDPVHGSIEIHELEKPVLEHQFFQRLRNIKQLGFSELVFPGATHTRYLHSIGVFFIANKAFDKIFSDQLNDPDILRLKQTLKMACLLHDIGHAPLSHSTEKVMPMLSELKLAKRFFQPSDLKQDRQATHEDYTIKAITEGSFSDSLSLLENGFGINRNNVAELIVGNTSDPKYFTHGGINYFPILHQLVSSEMDCDRMDYLLRDSYFCGVPYGQYDIDWIIDNIQVCCIKDEAHLGISERAVSTFDDFLLSRFHMFLQVYFHYRAVCLEKLLEKYFDTSDGEYTIPSKIEEYQKHDDYFLAQILRGSDNTYAKQITSNQIPPKVFESFTPQQHAVLDMICDKLDEFGIEYIKCSSKNRLSKYYGGAQIPKNRYPIMVARQSLKGEASKYVDIAKATDLYRRYSEVHGVNRLHCSLENLSGTQRQELQSLIKFI